MSAELSTESELQRTNDDSEPSHSAVKIFKVKRHRDDAPSETISKGCGVGGASKKKRTNRDTPESVAVQLEAFSLTHKTRTNNFGRNRVFKRIATMKKLKKKDEVHLVVHSLKSNFKNKRGHKRRSKRIGLVSKITKTTHSNKRDTRSKQRHKKRHQFELGNKRTTPNETLNPLEKHNTTDHYDVPSHKELIIDIYRSTADKKERRYWRRRYPYLREEDPSNKSDSECEDEETDTEGENEEEDEDDDYVYDYYIAGHQYIQEMIASGCQIVEVDFDGIEPECEEFLGNDYPEDESDSAKDYFSTTDEEDPDDFAPFY